MPNSIPSQPTSYTFDHVYSPKSTTQQLYQESCQNIIENFVDGYNGTIICYGQTSSGKTYTMSGNESSAGILDLAIQQIEKLFRDAPHKTFYLAVSYIEIYKEKFSDLLSDQQYEYKLENDQTTNSIGDGFEIWRQLKNYDFYL